ncbi:3-hydroxyacyl-ACP dehydratase FabZ family protein [Streptomyces sp. MH13]|uniref:3-hydroxyacyl-ACP dehydratase FabZ family protein n=1 Tax=Streptomyces sp. MH13 TaxID=3417651 RepID=UPI003CEC87E6
MTAADAGPAPSVAGSLPHRYPMLLVDRVVDVVPGERIRAVKAITVNEPWYAGTAPDADLAYPPSLLVESWGQTAGLLTVAGGGAPADQIMLFGSVADAVFHHPVLPGDVVEHRVVVTRTFTDSVVFEGSSHCGDRTVMTVGQMVMAFRPAGLLRPAGPDAPTHPSAATGNEAER